MSHHRVEINLRETGSGTLFLRRQLLWASEGAGPAHARDSTYCSQALVSEGNPQLLCIPGLSRKKPEKRPQEQPRALLHCYLNSCSMISVRNS